MKILKTEIHPISLPRIQFNGDIQLITKNEQLLSMLEKLQGVTMVGFDTETKPSFQKGEYHKMALLQLSTDTTAYLIRLHHITNFHQMIPFFENKNILKIGLALRDDIKGLQKIASFEPTGLVELQDLARHKKLNNMGLKGMCEEVIGHTISKKFKLTNWEAKELNQEQMLYAATDAWIGLKIYLALEHK